jgi:membrane associated rhomboid family serine protease
MILLVPVSPEVPKIHRPRLWPALLMVLSMGILYLGVQGTIQKDSEYVDSIQDLLDKGKSDDADKYLKLRPLLKIAPAKASWSVKKLILANFIHGSNAHLLLNLVGVFAGVRICTTFLPFLCTLAIFLLGGTLGLCISLFVTEQISPYIPHVGASAGIFALMGTYYVYNFKFRTSYFFWFPWLPSRKGGFPSRRGFTSLRTSWFFFADVILLEFVLSLAQLFPERMDSVDHIAHVAGFITGAILALLLRTAQRWPSFLQTRGEFLYWTQHLRPKIMSSANQSSWVVRAYLGWLELLQMNRYNDELKLQLCAILTKYHEKFMDTEIAEGFKHFNPTFIRLHTWEVSETLRAMLSQKRKLPTKWLVKLPYDSVIRLSKFLAEPAEQQHLLYELIQAYKNSQPPGSEVQRKLELLILKLGNIIKPEGEKSDTNTEGSSLPKGAEDSKEEMAKVGS